jgi:hypothetical protein
MEANEREPTRLMIDAGMTEARFQDVSITTDALIHIYRAMQQACAPKPASAPAVSVDEELLEILGACVNALSAIRVAHNISSTAEITAREAIQRAEASKAREVIEQAQRAKMQQRFANRTPSPATADFDLPSPNDGATDPAKSAEHARVCEHRYSYFGTEQPRRRCDRCNQLEPAAGEAVNAELLEVAKLSLRLIRQMLNNGEWYLTEEWFDAAVLTVERAERQLPPAGTKLFTYPYDAAARIASLEAEIAMGRRLFCEEMARANEFGERLLAVADERDALRKALEKLVRDADAEPDGDYLDGAPSKGCVAVHRSGIERARTALAAQAGNQEQS